MERPTTAVNFGEARVKSQVNEEREREREPTVKMERGEGELAGGEICVLSEMRFVVL